jgi:adenylate kinase family enzyme
MSINSMSTADYRRNVERKKVSAEKYLAQHRIRWLLEQVTSELVLLTPNEPIDFMVKRIEQMYALADSNASTEDIAIQRPRLLCVLGGPASGKAVPCAFLTEDAGMSIIAPSELIRDEIRLGTETGKEIGELLHRGETVPTAIITKLIQQHITDPKGSYVLDGYPRTLEQCLALESQVAEISLAIFLECSEETMVQRMGARQGGEDDHEPLRSEKLQYFQLRTIPVIEYLKAVGKLVAIDGEANKVEAIRQVQTVLNQQ